MLLKMNFEFHHKTAKMLANFEIFTKGVKKIRQKARQKENIKFRYNASMLDETFVE